MAGRDRVWMQPGLGADELVDGGAVVERVKIAQVCRCGQAPGH